MNGFNAADLICATKVIVIAIMYIHARAMKRTARPEIAVSVLPNKSQKWRCQTNLTVSMLDASQILRQIVSVEQGDSAVCVVEFSAFISTS